MAGISEIAEAAGVSLATVSRAINGNPDVSPQTREKVLAAAAKLNYTPSVYARNLRRSRTGVMPISHVVGILLFEFSKFHKNPFVWELVIETEAALTRRGYGARLVVCDPGGKIPACVDERSVDGALCFGAGRLVREMAELIPVVTVDYHSPGSRVYALVPDYRTGIADVTTRLIDAGHRKIVFLSGESGREEGLLFPDEVVAGAKQAFARRNIPVPPMNELVPCLADDPVSGYAAGRRLFIESKDHPDAVVVSDGAVLGLYRAIADAGLRVPEDVSVVGIDGLQQSEFMNPPLTTISTNIAGLADRSVDLILNMVKNNEKRSAIEFTPVSLVERKSARLTKGESK